MNYCRQRYVIHACVVMVYVGMAYMVRTCIVMAYIVMAYCGHRAIVHGRHVLYPLKLELVCTVSSALLTAPLRPHLQHPKLADIK